MYNDPPNTEPWSVFGLDLMPVPDIQISDHSKTGCCVRFASLDRFGMKKIFLMTLINKTI